MSKLSGAYYEIHHMEQLADRDQWVNHIHPLVKLVVTVFYIATVVSVNKYDLARVLILGVYPIAVFILGEISFTDSVRRVRLILPLVCIVGIFNPLFDRQVVAHIGNISITTGMISMVTLILKGVYTVFATYLLIAATTIEKICYAMRLVHLPGILVTQILLTYRYISVLLKEANTIMQAYSLRAPHQKGVHFKVWGSLIGQLLLRSIDRADNVYASMSLRGYNGEFHGAGQEKCKGSDYGYLLIWAAVLVILRYVI
ncbi:MAG: cobalt ECF transporter T component CbiQ [Hespellia sp.]|nr:cobalt ECF transporter T component CbiQ [Hespellia sp.]